MDEPRRISGAWLGLLAIGIGIAVVALESILFSILTDRPMTFAGDVEPVNALLAAIPFLVLALIGVRTWMPWLVGLALTVAAWGYVLYEGVSYQWHPDGSGANIGLGLIMIFIVPPFITAASFGTFAWQRRKSG